MLYLSSPAYFLEYFYVLEEESCVQVECEATILLVEALCALECHDEVLVHNEAKTETGGTVESVFAVNYELIYKSSL